MFIIGRFLVGNESYFDIVKNSALDVLLGYLFLIKENLTLREILEELTSGKEKEKYGFDSRYEPNFTKYITPLIVESLERLTSEDFVINNTGNYQVTEALYNLGKIYS